MSESAEIAIETLGLSKQYGERTVVDDLTFTVDAGAIFGFLGPNGAGKSTTMRLLTTLTAPSSGEAWVAGHSIRNRRAVSERIGYLPEEPPLYEELSGLEQLRFAAGIRDLDPAVSRERIDSYLERFELDGDADARIAGYSHGMRQKLGLIQAVLHEPEVVFLDEPTSGPDPRATRTLRETIQSLSHRGTTVFISTHVLPEVEAIADAVGVIHEGRLVATGDPDTLIDGVGRTDATLEDAFLELTVESD